MRIVVDMQGAQSGSRFRGIGRYTIAFVQALVRNSPADHQFILALNGLYPETIEPIRSLFADLVDPGNIVVWHGAAPIAFLDADNDWRRLSAEAIREAFLESCAPDLILLTSLVEGATENVATSIHTFDKRTPTAVILYDLIPLFYPEDYLQSDQAKAWYSEKIEHLKRADIWLAISESSRREGVEKLSLPEDRVFNVSAAIDPSFTPREFTPTFSNSMQRKFSLRKPFIMYSGASDARKNIYRLIDAFGRLPADVRKAYHLLIAGGMPAEHRQSLESHVRSNGLDLGDVIFSGHISDEEMLWFYCHCNCYVFPSYHEGFGLPALEAMACGKAVIGADATSIPEVIGNPEALFDPFSVEAIRDALQRVLTDTDYRVRLEQHALKQAARFSWDGSACLALDAFAEFFTDKPAASFASVVSDDLEHRLTKALVGLTSSATSEDDLLTVAMCANRVLPRLTATRYLYVDISELYRKDAGTGIQRVVRSIINVWADSGVQGFEVAPVYASMTDCYRHTTRYTSSRQCSVGEGEPIDPRAGDVFLGLDLNDLLVDSKRSYYAQLKALGVTTYFVVYDLLPINCSGNFPPEARINFEKWLTTVTEADGALCISQSVADELEAWLETTLRERITPFHIGWFHLGADIDGSAPSRGLPEEADEVLGLLAASPSFLMVGTVEPRKRHHQVLVAFEQLWREGVQANLVIVGKRGWMVDSLAAQISSHPELGHRLFWISSASDEYLERLYDASSCLIAASEGEGFGLPLIEAAKYGLPIIARDLPVFKEVAGPHALYFNGAGGKPLAEAVVEWLRLRGLDQVPDSSQIPWLTWRQSADQLASLITEDVWYKTWP